MDGPEGIEDWGCLGWLFVIFAVICGIIGACEGGRRA